MILLREGGFSFSLAMYYPFLGHNFAFNFKLFNVKTVVLKKGIEFSFLRLKILSSFLFHYSSFPY